MHGGRFPSHHGRRHSLRCGARWRRGRWVSSGVTRSGHIEKSSLKKPHPKASKLAKVAQFPPTCFGIRA
jgi:hypothetical protein